MAGTVGHGREDSMEVRRKPWQSQNAAVVHDGHIRMHLV